MAFAHFMYEKDYIKHSKGRCYQKYLAITRLRHIEEWSWFNIFIMPY